ncbi:MAG: tetratricopeptide repeat protein, partial [Woeseiaceae bacterium]|nr:tetratricopeptide repeat protein [Woeseiaceae bacterium]
TALVDARSPGYGEATDSMAVRRFMAMALSNRGVARALKGQYDLAAADFEKAIDIKSRLAEPAINLARLERVVTTGA